MDLDTDDDILRELADGKPMDYEQWPALYSRLILRLDKIVHGGFYATIQPTIPSSQPTFSPSRPETIPNGAPSSQSSTQSTNKENSPPTSTNSTNNNPHLSKEILTLHISITTTLSTYFTKYPPHTIQRVAELFLTPNLHYKKLSSYLHALDRVVHVTSGANIFPLPLAIPDPSTLSILSNGTPTDPLASSITWGKSTTTAQITLGSDESLGGALLTPISWLTKPTRGGSSSPLSGTGGGGAGEVKTESTEMIEGPNGPGGIETVSVSINGVSSPTARDQVTSLTPSSSSTSPSSGDDLSATLRAEGGVTQGELLRQEQEAGVVPASQLIGSQNTIGSALAKGNVNGTGEDDEMPHVRGPEAIGMEDLGPQSEGGGIGLLRVGGEVRGIDIEAAIGRKLDEVDSDGDVGVKDEGESEGEAGNRSIREGTPKREADEELVREGKRVRSQGEDGEGDVELSDVKDEETVIVDAEGKTGEENKEIVV